MEKRSLKKYFDKVYVINYIEGKERRENIKQMFSDYGLIDDIEFIYGMPFNKISAIKPHFSEIAKMTPRDAGSINAIGCSFSHYIAVKTAYETGCKTVLIFEDDIIIRNDLDLIFDYLDNAPADWNYLYFTLSYPHDRIILDDINLIKSSTSKWIDMKSLRAGKYHDIEGINNELILFSGAYAMDRKAMELYIKLFENSGIITNSDMIEYFFHNISQSPLNMYIPKETLFSLNDHIDALVYDNETGQYKINWWSVPYATDSNSTNFLKKYKRANGESFIWAMGGKKLT